MVTALVLTALGSSPVQAGARKVTEVTIGGSYAYGSLGSARNSADGKQYIGCNLVVTSGSPSRVSCTARNAAGVTVACQSFGPEFLDAVHAMNGDSYVVFMWNSDGFCTSIGVDNNSQWEPKE